MRNTIGLLFFLISTVINAQGRLVLNDNPYLVLNDGAAGTPVFVVVDNPNENAIATIGTGGNVISENEFNKIRWRINNQTGNYTLPFTTNNNVKIPLTMSITGAGSGGTHIDFSTYSTTPENDVYPSMVMNLSDAGTAESDFSYWMVDRFWIIDAQNYTSKPSSSINFDYDQNELQAPNLSFAGNLAASRYNSTSDEWSGTNLNWGTDNILQSRVENAVIPSNELFEVWTLIDYVTPLPVELLYFSAQCEETFVHLSWATSSEQNTMNFEVEKSINGNQWEVIAQLPAQGTTSQETNYSYRDYNPSQQTAYYRLVQTDFDGVSETFDIQSVEACGEENNAIWVFNQLDGQYQLTINANNKERIAVNLFDMNGKQVRQTKEYTVVNGNNVFLFNDSSLSAGIYMLTVEGPNLHHTYKLIIQK